MDFLKPEVRKYFFHDEPKIYSKVDDLPPAKYNIGSDVRNSLIASGCIVNSKVENSILFKKVFVGKNCVIKNSIILNDVYIGDNTHIENCIVESVIHSRRTPIIVVTTVSRLYPRTTKGMYCREGTKGGQNLCRLRT